jgi:hypothetical protein
VTDNIKKIPEQTGRPPQKMQAMVVAVPLFMQMVELIRGNVSHREADPILQQIATLAPQEVTLRND